MADKVDDLRAARVRAVPRYLSALASLRLFVRRKSRARYVAQIEASDCGVACLSSVLQFFRVPHDRQELRAAVAVGRNGVSALGLMRAAELHGLQVTPVRADADRAGALAMPAILHWKGDHFVVLEAVTPAGFRIMDPSTGFRTLTQPEFTQQYSGVALQFAGAAPLASKRGGRRRPADGTWRQLASFANFPRVWAKILICAVLIQLLSLSFPIIMAFVLNRRHQGDDVMSLLAIASMSMLVIQALLAGIRGATLSWLRTRVDLDLTLALLEKAFRAPITFFERRTVGDVLLRIRSTVLVRQAVSATVLSLFVDGGTSVVLLIGLAFFNLPIALTTVGFVLAISYVARIGWMRQQELIGACLESQSRSQSELLDMLAGVRTLRLAGTETHAVRAWGETFAREVSAESTRNMSAVAVESLMTCIRLAAPLVLLMVGMAQLREGRLQVGTMVGAVTLGVGVLTPVTSLLNSILQVSGVAGYLTRMQDIFLAPVEVRDLRVGGLATVLELADVSFTHPGESEPLFAHLDLTLTEGTRVAIIGRNGAGKSTIALLLAGLYAPSQGTVSLNNQPLARIERDSLYSRVGLATQSPHFFRGSILDNILLGRPCAISEVIEAAERAGLGRELKHGVLTLQTDVGEGGQFLSGGQRQKVGLARVLLGKPRILILDEATNAIDAQGERWILNGLLRRSDLGVVLITHRKQVAHLADEILMLTGEGLTSETDYVQQLA